jgi:spore maturation protein CgeB
MQDTVQLFTAQNGQLSAKAVFPDSIVRHIHSLVDPAAEGKYYERLDFWGDVIVLAATGLGYHLMPRLHAVPENTVIVAFDFYEALIDHCRKNIFSRIKNRVVTFSGATAPDKAAAAAAAMRLMPSAKIQVIKHPASFDMHRRFYETILDSLVSPLAKSAEIRKPATRGAAGAAIVMHGNFFLEEEVLNAFRQSAAEPRAFHYNGHASPLEYENALLRTIQAARPSLIFSVNMKGIDTGGVFAQTAARFGIPLVVWFVDDPRRILGTQLMHSLPPSPSAPPIVAACWERAYIPWLERAGFSKVLYLPLATDPSLFRAAAAAAPTVDVGFVGTSMVDEFSGKIKEKFLWSDRLIPLVNEASERLLAKPDYDVDNDIPSLAKRIGIDLPFSDVKNLSWLCAYIIHTASMEKRKSIIGGLIREGIELFGDSGGWKRLLGPEVVTHPDIDYRSGLAEAYRAIRINVNITSCQMPSAVNQRVFDIPVAGSFVLSDDQKDLRELFEIGREAIVYDGMEDLKDKIRFYRTHEAERVKIIAAAYKRILSEHTYAMRIGSLLSLL